MPLSHPDTPTHEDSLGRLELVRRVGDLIAACTAPRVVGILGEWGSGKTSALAQLGWYLSGSPQPAAPQLLDATPASQWPGWKLPASATVIWFEAWRYQHEALPVVALLHEIRQQLPLSARALRSTQKLAETAVRGALLSLEDLTKRIGFQASKIQQAGERWEQEHYETALPTHVIREQLEAALGALLGKAKPGQPAPRLVVLIDDLDRCEPEAAYRLLEGIKIYLNLSNCVFVLAMNQRIVERALAKAVAKDEGAPTQALRAREYLEKLCQETWHLPLLVQPRDYFLGLLRAEPALQPAHHIALRELCNKHRFLPPNPRRVKALANVLVRFLEESGPGVGTGEEITRHLALLIVLASLYLFHPELYRRIEWDLRFYLVLRDWALGIGTSHPAVAGIARPEEPVTQATGPGTAATPPSGIPSSGAGAPPAAGATAGIADPLTDEKAPAAAASPSTGSGAPAGTSAPVQLFPTHPDPEQGNTLRIQSLMQMLESVTDDELRERLLQGRPLGNAEAP